MRQQENPPQQSNTPLFTLLSCIRLIAVAMVSVGATVGAASTPTMAGHFATRSKMAVLSSCFKKSWLRERRGASFSSCQKLGFRNMAVLLARFLSFAVCVKGCARRIKCIVLLRRHDLVIGEQPQGYHNI